MTTCLHLTHVSCCKKLEKPIYNETMVSSTEQKPPPEIPENNVWQLDNNGYKILWFEGTATPSIIVVMDSAEEDGWFKIPLNCLYRFSYIFFLLS